MVREVAAVFHPLVNCLPSLVMGLPYRAGLSGWPESLPAENSGFFYHRPWGNGRNVPDRQNSRERPLQSQGVSRIRAQETSLIYRRVIEHHSPLIRGDLQGPRLAQAPAEHSPHSALSLNPSTAPPASLREAIYDVLSISVLARERGGDGWSLGSYPSVTWPQSLKRF